MWSRTGILFSSGSMYEQGRSPWTDAGHAPEWGDETAKARAFGQKGEERMDYAAESLKLHYQWRGKLDIVPKMEVKDKQALS